MDADERDRVQMVLLAAEGWRAPRIARHLGVSDKTVRRLLKGWRMQGEQALFKKLPGPAPDSEKSPRGEIRPLLHGRVRLQPDAAHWLQLGRRRHAQAGPYENPQRRRVNALVAYRPAGNRPGLRFLVRPRTKWCTCYADCPPAYAPAWSYWTTWASTSPIGCGRRRTR
ncbi:helix-turn-helix domain-containing protein [Corallococcus aberystwythensis]|uniref:Helix-turn-helix domain-containing protein n=1 Tax=Corallococcus aberystwythensis TaxID=2316722 RepID=A0A3A8QXU1_9BACT|nr:helix-turn-helix domain-containing protein [Corallococcus aberystwythensis]